MENKRLLLQFFHERAYRPQPLAAFEDEARRAAALGAEFRRITRTGTRIPATRIRTGACC